MDNLALNLIDEHVKESFVVDNDSKAEWAVKKLDEERKQLQRMTLVIDSMIAEYQFKKQQAEKEFDTNTNWIKGQLEQYFENVEGKKATKTKVTYSLPSAKLVKKLGGQEFKRDEEALVEWLESSNREDLIKVKKSADWITLKKEVKVVGDSVISIDGEIVNGVTVTNKEDVFDIEF